MPIPFREPYLGYVWGIFLIVGTMHLGNLLGYRASRRGLHGKLFLHQQTGYLIQAGRYAALTLLLIILTFISASSFLAGTAVADFTSSARQLLWLRRIPTIQKDDLPPNFEPPHLSSDKHESST